MKKNVTGILIGFAMSIAVTAYAEPVKQFVLKESFIPPLRI